MFEIVDVAPPDAILGLTEAFKNDPDPNKVNLTVGAYKDANGTTPVLACVKEAERRLLDQESTKSYLPIDGLHAFDEHVQKLLFGVDHEIIRDARAVTVQTPGGTGAVRVGAEFVRRTLGREQIYLSEPTWPNHPNIVRASGLAIETYRYFNSSTNSIDLDGFMADLSRAPAKSVVLLHPCCHNPTGVDPSAEQWNEIADIVIERDLLPFLDFAYQGFGKGLDEDAKGLRAFCRPGCEMLVCSSYSKNFGLYSERVGALTAVAKDADAARAVLSQIKKTVRANYSNPPFHGAAIVATILNDPSLCTQWEEELATMRNRILGMRDLFARTMSSLGASRDFSFIREQVGMFSFSGLTPEQVDRLRDEHSIYIVRNGRINVAGMTEENMAGLCEAIKSIIG